MYTNKLTDSELQKRKIPRDDTLRGNYYRDQTAIIHSRPFRRLKHKTQVFFSPDNDHVCTRIEHVLHVATIAATVCKGLNHRSDKQWKLNEELAYSIGIGHDVGHTPFGHAGEEALHKLLQPESTFMHEINSYRMLEKLVNYGEGLNLTYAVNDGIICHCGERFEKYMEPVHEVKNLDQISSRANIPSTYEGCIMRFADKIAYLGRDIEDAIIGRLIRKEDIPATVRKQIGSTNGEIIHYFIGDLIQSSDNGKISFSEEGHEMFLELKNFNYKNIYMHPGVLEYESYCTNIIRTLYDFYMKLLKEHSWDNDFYYNSEKKLVKSFGAYLYKMEQFYRKEAKERNSTQEEQHSQLVTDYISGMTDNYALECMQDLCIPRRIL